MERETELRNVAYVTTGYGLSHHAIVRFRARFKDFNIIDELALAILEPKRVTKKKMNTLKRDCPYHAEKMAVSRYLINHNNIVFVVVDKLVVTVFNLDSKINRKELPPLHRWLKRIKRNKPYERKDQDE